MLTRNCSRTSPSHSLLQCVIWASRQGNAKYRFVLLSNTLLPICFIAALFLVYKLVVCFEVHYFQKQLNDPAGQRAALKNIQLSFSFVFSFYLVIIYPSISSALLQFFNYDVLEVPEGDDNWTW